MFGCTPRVNGGWPGKPRSRAGSKPARSSGPYSGATSACPARFGTRGRGLSFASSFSSLASHARLSSASVIAASEVRHGQLELLAREGAGLVHRVVVFLDLERTRRRDVSRAAHVE